MTETSCLISSTPPGDPLPGHVGPPSPACEVRAQLTCPAADALADTCPLPLHLRGWPAATVACLLLLRLPR